MYSNTQYFNSLLAAFVVCGALILGCTPARANSTLTITGNLDQVYNGSINAGPYHVTLTGDNLPDTTSGLLVFCLDDTKTTFLGVTYTGALNAPASQIEEEAAFLAAYSLSKGAPSSDPEIVSDVEGPISLAIWQLMGTLGTQAVDPKALQYIQIAEYAFTHGLITNDFLAQVRVFVPDANIQPFILAVRDDAMIHNATPEPGTWLLLVTGIGLIALGRRRSRG